MSKFKTCKHCNEEFDLHSKEKIQAGGYIDECPWCIEEMGGDKSAPKYLGVAAGNGKMSDLTILQFNSPEERETYKKAWRNNNGQNKGRSCQLGNHMISMSGMKFKVHSENRANDNHKGKG